MSGPGTAPAGWYPDPSGAPGLRYFDGRDWTQHQAPPPGYPAFPVRPMWKGMTLGRPQNGPGALAEPGRRLGARVLDGLLLSPVLAGFVTLAVVLVRPHVGPLFPTFRTYSTSPGVEPGIIWIELAVLGAAVASGVVMILYETIATARFGRTLGKAWLRIRPVSLDGRPVGWWRAFGRVSLLWLAAIFNWLGLIDVLWCLWDDNRQCLHDKGADTIVVYDGSFEAPAGPDQTAVAPTWVPSGPWPPTPPPYWFPYGYGGPPVMRTHPNGFAVASLVCSLLGFLLLGITGLLGVVFGFVARYQIRRSQGAQSGSGLALAGIIVGFAIFGLWTSLFVVGAITNHGTNNGQASVAPAGSGASDPNLAIPGAPGYTTLDGPDGLPLAVGRPWGPPCQPIVFSVNHAIPALADQELAVVVAQARATGVDVTLEDPQGYWQPGDLYPPGLTNAEVKFVPVSVDSTAAPKLSDGGPEHIGFGWDGHPSADGIHDQLTGVQATLYARDLADPAAYRLADRQLIGFAEGVAASTAPGSGIARDSNVDGFSSQDTMAMRMMSGCTTVPPT